MPDEITRAIEAILLVADAPVEPGMLAEILEIRASEVEDRCNELAMAYDVDNRGYVVARVAGGYRLQTHTDLAPYVERFLLEGQSARLSAAALETLAIIAYKQPISRAQVSAIRGVNVEAVMRTLEQRGYVAEIGRDPGPGQAVLFGTTREFLERLGIDSIDDLPPLSGFVPGPDVVEALEVGLRPHGLPTPSPVADAEPVIDLAGASADESEGEEGDDEEPTARERWQDATERLDDATERLDALVEQVRVRLAETEAAVAEADTDTDAGTDAGSETDPEPTVDLTGGETGEGDATVDLSGGETSDPEPDDVVGPLSDA